MNETKPHAVLNRELGVFHAVLLGLGSILGTGVFVSIGIAAGIAGPSVLIAIVLAALLALCNGLSSAQLAAAHPVAGGTYEYGYRFLHPKLGFTAGWMFLLAKSASAATAAIGVSAMIIYFVGESLFANWYWVVGPVCFVFLIVTLVLTGLRRSAITNSFIVLFTIAGLLVFIFVGLFSLSNNEVMIQTAEDIAWIESWPALMTATALMFVAYTGYGRIATLGEEVHDPKRTIPIAVLATLSVCAVLYVAVGFVFSGSARFLSFPGGGTLENLWVQATSLEAAAIWMNFPAWARLFVAIAAITAMLGVLLNLVLGLSRVLLAMGRRRDVPGLFDKVNTAGTTPVPAVIAVGLLIAGLTLLGDVKTTWTFAAFTVLIYYGITNLAALKLPPENRLYPRAFAWAGLGGCLFLCWWVEPVVWMVGVGLIAAGLVWHTFAPKMFGRPPLPTEVCTQCGYDLRASSGACPECGQPIPDAKPTRNASTDGS